MATEPNPRPPTPPGQVIPPGGAQVPQGAPTFTSYAPIRPVTAKPAAAATPPGPPLRKLAVAKGKAK